MEVGVHKLVYQVHIVEVVALVVWRAHDVFQRNDVLVFELPQDLDLPEYPPRVRRVLEGARNLLDRYLAARAALVRPRVRVHPRRRGGRLLRGAYHTVRPATHRLDWHVAAVDLEGLLPASSASVREIRGFAWKSVHLRQEPFVGGVRTHSRFARLHWRGTNTRTRSAKDLTRASLRL